MSDQAGIPQDLRDAANAAACALAIAKAVVTKQFPAGGAPDNLLPALMLSASIARASAAICNQLERAIDRAGENADGLCVELSSLTTSVDSLTHETGGICDALEHAGEPRLNERLAGLEEEVHRVGNLLIDLRVAAGALLKKPGRGDGTK